MNISNKAVDVLVTSILGATDKKISVAPYDKTVQCIVVSKNGYKDYTVTSKDKTYNVKTDLVLEVGQVVNLMFTQNNPNNTMVLPSSYLQKVVATNPELTTQNGVCTWQCVHNKGTLDVVVTIINISTGQVVKDCDVIISSTNGIVVKFNSSSNIGANTYKAVII